MAPPFPCINPRLRGDSLFADGFLQFLRRAESDLLLRGDLDGFAGRRVAALARSALRDLQNAEAGDADAVALLEVLGQHRDQVVHDLVHLLLRHLVLLGEVGSRYASE